MVTTAREIDDAPDTIPMETVDGEASASVDPIAELGPHCPACGFRVFNRRYPKCESCGAELPPDVAYSDVERHRLMAAEEALALEVARQSRSGPVSGAMPLDDPIVTALVDGTDTLGSR